MSQARRHLAMEHSHHLFISMEHSHHLLTLHMVDQDRNQVQARVWEQGRMSQVQRHPGMEHSHHLLINMEYSHRLFTSMEQHLHRFIINLCRSDKGPYRVVVL